MKRESGLDVQKRVCGKVDGSVLDARLNRRQSLRPSDKIAEHLTC